MLAAYLFGLLDGSPADDHVREFFIDSLSVWEAAERAPGYLGRSEPHGPLARVPRVFHDYSTCVVVQGLSLWADLTSAQAFARRVEHRAVVHRCRPHLIRTGWPTHVLWWTREVPTFDEGAVRLEQLHDRGSSPDAFTLEAPHRHGGSSAVVPQSLRRGHPGSSPHHAAEESS
jgi:hypothetical protein